MFSKSAVAVFYTGVAVSVQEIDALSPENRTSHQFLLTLDDFLRDKVELPRREGKRGGKDSGVSSSGDGGRTCGASG